MMLKKTAALLAGLLLLAGCAGTPSSEGEAMNEEVYRGVVSALADDSLLVTQVEGHNYGQPAIRYNYSAEVLDEAGGALADGAYVEVRYDGKLTRSLPPQGTAAALRVITPQSEGVVQNGRVVSAEETDEGYAIGILPLDAPDGATEAEVILNVPKDGLEGLKAEDLQPGLEVSAVTTGVAALSLPPQMPVVVLLPYTTTT